MSDSQNEHTPSEFMAPISPDHPQHHPAPTAGQTPTVDPAPEPHPSDPDMPMLNPTHFIGPDATVKDIQDIVRKTPLVGLWDGGNVNYSSTDSIIRAFSFLKGRTEYFAEQISQAASRISSLETTISQLSGSVSKQIEAVTVFSYIPSSFQTSVITVTNPHKRQFVWNGSEYVRAPWDQPGIIRYTANDVDQLDGHLPLVNSGAYHSLDYPELSKHFGTEPGEGVWFTTVGVGGCFIRALNSDDPKLRDYTRTNATFQEDAIQHIQGAFPSNVPQCFQQTVSGCFGTTAGDGDKWIKDRTIYSTVYSSPGYEDGHRYGYVFDASIVARTADETRPYNVAFKPWISY